MYFQEKKNIMIKIVITFPNIIEVRVSSHLPQA